MIPLKECEWHMPKVYPLSDMHSGLILSLQECQWHMPNVDPRADI